MHINTLSIVGVGLLGGSIALAARQRRVAERIVGFDRSEAVLTRAQTAHLLDEASTDIAHAVQDADLVVFCTPVDFIARGVIEAAPLCRPGAVLTDVGSTKASIIRDLTGQLPDGTTFVGSHPLAGSEKTGPENARADLFDNCLVVVTAPPDAPSSAGAFVMAFWHALGASVVPMPAEEHDRALAMTSHLPHLVASALAATLPDEWRWLTATGFRDTTRIAAGSPELWRAIFLHNQGPVLQALDHFRATLDCFRQALAEGDAEELLRILQRGKQVRDSLTRR